MATITLGSQGLLNADLVLVQNVSFSATIIHEDDEGHPVDHTGWTAYCQAQGKTNIDLSDCISFGEEGMIHIYIPDDVTKELPLSNFKWDIIVEDDTGFATRLVYGKINVYDSYARDE